MVQNSEKTYGELMQEAAALTDKQEVGETVKPLLEQFKSILEDTVQKNYNKGTIGKYYIHLWVQKEPYAQNALRVYAQCRRTRPSPYQGHDHYLWSVEDEGKITFEWCIPKKEVLTYILKNPHEFDVNYVRMLKKFAEDKLEKLEDYLVEGKIA